MNDATSIDAAVSLAALVLLLVGAASWWHSGLLARRLKQAATRAPLDPESGLLNRSAALDRIEAERLRASRMGWKLQFAHGSVESRPEWRTLRLPDAAVGMRLTEREVLLCAPETTALELPEGWVWRSWSQAADARLPEWLGLDDA